MLNKLTLTVDKQVIEMAKLYAQSKNKSVSRLVQDYLQRVSSQPITLQARSSETLSANPVSGAEPIHAPITSGLVGMFADTGQDDKTMLEEAIFERHVC